MHPGCTYGSEAPPLICVACQAIGSFKAAISEEGAHERNENIVLEGDESLTSDKVYQKTSGLLKKAKKHKPGRRVGFHPSVLIWPAAEVGDTDEMDRLILLLLTEKNMKKIVAHHRTML